MTEIENNTKSLWSKFKLRFVHDFMAGISLASRQSHFRALLRFFLILSTLITVYAVIFQLIMGGEGQQHSFITGFYWTLSTMSTLGYGDIAFRSDPGRLFSIFVLLSGVIFLLVLLPFTFIELFWAPWMESRSDKLVPRSVPESLQGHVILTFYGSVASALIAKLEQFDYPYVVILSDVEEVTRLRDTGIEAIYGELNDPATYKRARIEQAAMVATTNDDITNTSVAFTARGIAANTPIIATAREKASVEILRLAGCNRVLDPTELMAEGLARRAIGGNCFSHVVGQIDDLLIAEVDASRTTLVGKNYLESQWQTSVSIVGFWESGKFEVGRPESVIDSDSVLVLAGSKRQMEEFDKNYQADKESKKSMPVIIIGGGRVGRATASALTRRGIDYRIVEILEERIHDSEKSILGSGADRSVLQRAGFDAAPTVIITLRDDQTNIYLAIYCRLLSSDIQIISRTTFDRNAAAMQRAGSNIVMSSASIGANALFNLLQRSDVLMIAEGLDVFKVPVPSKLAGKTLVETDFRQTTNCTVIGIDSHDQTNTMTDAGADTVLPVDGEIVLIGTPAGQTEFLRLYPPEDNGN